MKKRIMLSVMVIALAAALIAGATSAWFTDDAEVPEAEFLAGTVLVDADKPTIHTMEGRFFDNVNPGDCAIVVWKIKNIGTKNAELRVKLDKEWESQAGSVLLAKINEEFGTDFDKGALTNHLNALERNENNTNVVYYAPAPGSGWEIYEADDGLWLYYTDGPVDGTYYEGEEGYEGEVELPLVVYFHGGRMDNRYMKANFRIGGIVEAIQATNGAPEEVWGKAWKQVNKEGYVPKGLARQYVKAVENTECYEYWKSNEPEDPEEPTNPEYDWVLIDTYEKDSGTGFISLNDKKIGNSWFRIQEINLPNENDSINIDIVAGNPENNINKVGVINIANVGGNQYNVTFSFYQDFPDNPAVGDTCKIVEAGETVHWNYTGSGTPFDKAPGKNLKGSLNGVSFTTDESSIEFYAHFENIRTEIYEYRLVNE